MLLTTGKSIPFFCFHLFLNLGLVLPFPEPHLKVRAYMAGDVLGFLVESWIGDFTEVLDAVEEAVLIIP